MGKGDIKTKRGKIANGSFGNLRLRKAEPEQEKQSEAKEKQPEAKEKQPEAKESKPSKK